MICRLRLFVGERIRVREKKGGKELPAIETTKERNIRIETSSNSSSNNCIDVDHNSGLRYLLALTVFSLTPRRRQRCSSGFSHRICKSLSFLRFPTTCGFFFLTNHMKYFIVVKGGKERGKVSQGPRPRPLPFFPFPPFTSLLPLPNRFSISFSVRPLFPPPKAFRLRLSFPSQLMVLSYSSLCCLQFQ